MGRGGISPAYFFDHMSFTEAAAYLRGMQRRERESWEQTRMIMYAIFQVNSKDELKPSDIMKFEWDEQDEPTEIDEEEVNRIREKMKRYEQHE